MVTLKMAIIFLMEQIRTPFSLIWTIMSPTVLFFFLHFNEIELHYGDTAWLGKQISWFVGYISFSVVLFNYCLYLVGRRESGFIATFVHNMDGRLLFIRSQLIASLIMSILYVFFFILVVLTGFQASPDYQIVMIILKSIYIYDGFTHFHGIVQSHIPNSQHYLFCINNCLYGIRNCIIKI